MFHNFPVSHRSDIFVLAIDVDLTLVDSLSTWFEAVSSPEAEFKVSEVPNPQPDQVIDLAPWLESGGVATPLSYWEGGLIYDNMKPNESFMQFYHDLCQALEDVTGKRVETIVVSSCFPEHEKSKRQLVKRTFGDNTPFISTSAKHMVDFDLIIDDSLGVAFNCIGAGKNILHAPSPLADPSLGTRLNKHFFHPGYNGCQWPYSWYGVDAYELAVELAKISNK